eukprot:1500254-Rhodomonas_salina.2
MSATCIAERGRDLSNVHRTAGPVSVTCIAQRLHVTFLDSGYRVGCGRGGERKDQEGWNGRGRRRDGRGRQPGR